MEPSSSFHMSGLSVQEVNAAVAMGIALGTLYCFLGYRVLRFLIGLTGFLLAGGVAAVLAGWLSGGHLIAMGLAMVIGGAAGAMALFFMYKAGIFCLGLLAAALMAHNALDTVAQPWIPLAVLGIGLAGGVFAVLTERPVMTVATAVLGAWVIVGGMGYFILGSGWLSEWTGTLSFNEERFTTLSAWFVLAGSGALAQFMTRKKTAGS